MALRSRLEEVLGHEHAATLMTMLPQRDDLATKADIDDVRRELASMRLKMEHGFATKDDLFGVMNQWNEGMRGYIRTFIVVQAATVVGMSSVLFGLLRFF